MLKRLVMFTAVATLVAALPASAQSKRVEIGVTAGWVFSDGVDGEPFLAGDGNIYDRVDPQDSFSWGLNLGFLVGENAEVGFLFGQQMSTLEADGTATREIGDFNINTYHGYFAYNFGPSDASVRPYVLAGLGATNYGALDFTRFDGSTGEIGGQTQFSTTWGAGVKFGGNSPYGGRFGVRWTPTYIKTDSVGWWCEPFWGCYVVGNAQYANQWEFNGGIMLRF